MGHSLLQIIENTMKFLGTENENQVAYITEELIRQEPEEIIVKKKSKEEMKIEFNGHSVTVGIRNNRLTYEFLSTSFFQIYVCKGKKRFFYYQDEVEMIRTNTKCEESNSYIYDFKY